MKMRTLLENITFVKGVEYLIVVAFCFGFIALWLLLNKERGTVKKMVTIAITLSLLFGGFAIVRDKYFDPDSAAGATLQNNGTNSQNKSMNINPDYFTISYGSAAEFHKVMSSKIDCSKCHHNSKEIQPCNNCHDKPFDPKTPDKPGLKAAIHLRCMSCHQDRFSGPDGCIFCHTGKVLEIAPSPPHHLTWTNCSRCHADGAEKEKQTNIVYHDNCPACHTKGVAGAASIPADHTGRTSNTCKGCHKPIE
jgi:DnaJ-class molecular chaperone